MQDADQPFRFKPGEFEAVQSYLDQCRMFGDAISSFRKSLEEDFTKQNIRPRKSGSLVQQSLLMVLRTVAHMHPLPDPSMRWEEYFRKSSWNVRARLEVMIAGMNVLTGWLQELDSEEDDCVMRCRIRATAVLAAVLIGLVDKEEMRMMTPLERTLPGRLLA